METVTQGSLTYKLEEDNEYSIVSCDADAESVEIPLSVNGIPVTRIADHAFECCEKLFSVIFPDDIELQIRDADSFEIGDYAFNFCTALEYIEIPYGVRYIGRGAFRSCRALKTVELPEFMLPRVSAYAFYDCTSLSNITSIDTVEEGVFQDCRSLEHFPVKSGARYIDEDAFRGCHSLKDITIPESVEWLEPLAFRSCHGLKRVTFEDPVGWRCSNKYTHKIFELDLSSPEKNAEMLSKIDFDDGIGTWRKTKA